MNIKLFSKFFFYNSLFLLVSLPGFIIAILIMYISPAPKVQKITNLYKRFLFASLNIKTTYHFTKIPDLQGALIVANHISWLDIMAISDIYKIMFIAKAELRKWPILGKVILKYGTIFIQKNHHNLKTVNAKITAEIDRGHRVALFPEGFTTDGDTVYTFKSAIFQIAIDTGCPIVPIVISYLDRNNNNIAPGLTYNNKNLWQSAKDTVRLSPVNIHIFQLPIVDPTQFSDRNQLCQFVQSQIKEQYLKVIKS